MGRRLELRIDFPNDERFQYLEQKDKVVEGGCDCLQFRHANRDTISGIMIQGGAWPRNRKVAGATELQQAWVTVSKINYSIIVISWVSSIIVIIVL